VYYGAVSKAPGDLGGTDKRSAPFAERTSLLQTHPFLRTSLTTRTDLSNRSDLYPQSAISLAATDLPPS
jgi:hypothetical protein